MVITKRVYNYQLISGNNGILGHAVLEKGRFRFEPDFFPLQNFTNEALREIADILDQIDKQTNK